MTGSLLALAAIGNQDKEFIGKPEKTFFKSVYRQHTHFVMEDIPIQFDQGLEFGKKSKITIPRKADLIHKMTLEINLPALESGISWINGAGHSLIEKITLMIGGVEIDSLTGEFLEILSQLEVPESKKGGYDEMIARHDFYTNQSQIGATTLYIPLQFWFCRDIGSSLPLVALQYSDVELEFTIRSFSQSWYSGTSMTNTPDAKQITNAQLHVEYIFLDSLERRSFASREHRYLIEQIQSNQNNSVSAGATQDNIDLHFNHPVKDLFWVFQANSVSDTNDWLNYSATLDNDQSPTDPVEPITKCLWRINGHDLMQEKNASYYRLVVPNNKYQRIPDNYIYVHSFSLKPDEYQPYGHLNFSVIQSAILALTYVSNIPAGVINVYARNYNILEIRKGQAGLLYSA